MKIEEFEEAIEQHGGHDIVIPYSQVAEVFASPEGHPESLEYKRIDKTSLLAWAESKKWRVEMLSEECSPQFPSSPPIRFEKIHG
jgi:hypothetical protein